MNAMWWVRYVDKNNPSYGMQLLSLCSPDLCDTKKAAIRARDTAVARLKRKGANPQVVSVQCVG